MGNAEEKSTLLFSCYSGLPKSFNMRIDFMILQTWKIWSVEFSNLFESFSLNSQTNTSLKIHWGAKGCMAKQEKLEPDKRVKRLLICPEEDWWPAN